MFVLPNGEGENTKLCADLVKGSAGSLQLEVVVLVDVTGKNSGLQGTLSARSISRADQDVESVGLVGNKGEVLDGAVLLIGNVQDHLFRGNDVTLDLIRGSSGDGAAVEQGSGFGDSLLNLNVAVSNLDQAQSSLGSVVSGANDIGSGTLNGLSGVRVDDNGMTVGGNVSINVSAQFTMFNAKDKSARCRWAIEVLFLLSHHFYLHLDNIASTQDVLISSLTSRGVVFHAVVN